MLEYELAFLIMVCAPCPVAFPTARSVKTFICTVSSLSFGRDRCSEAFHCFIVEYAHWVGGEPPERGTLRRCHAARRYSCEPSSARASSIRLATLCTGRNSSTCGSIARTPAGRASNPWYRRSGFSQMSFLHDLCRRSISFASPSPTSPSRPSEITSTTAFCPSTLRDHRRLNSRRQLPMRVPPDQSAIASDTPPIATSTSRWRRYRLMLVSRVPKTKLVTRSRSLVIVCRKWRNILEYRFIEPDTSHRT